MVDFNGNQPKWCFLVKIAEMAKSVEIDRFRENGTILVKVVRFEEMGAVSQNRVGFGKMVAFWSKRVDLVKS